MVTPIFLFLLLAGVSVALYVWFSSLPDPSLWRTAFLLTLGIGTLRTVSAVLGEVILENQSNWLQIPAYIMALARLPEAAFLPETVRSSRLIFGLAIFLGTGAWVFGIAGVAIRRRKRNPAA